MTQHHFGQTFFYQEEYISSLIYSNKIKAWYFYSTKRFIDDFFTVNDVGEFGRSICDIYSKELELKVEHRGDYDTFLNLDITIKEGPFTYKLFDKRDSFPFSVVRMPRVESNIPQNIFLFSSQRWVFKNFSLNSIPQGIYT